MELLVAVLLSEFVWIHSAGASNYRFFGDDEFTTKDFLSMQAQVERARDQVKLPPSVECLMKSQTSAFDDSVMINGNYYPLKNREGEFHPDYTRFVIDRLSDSLKNLDSKRLEPFSMVCGKDGVRRDRMGEFWAALFEGVANPESNQRLVYSAAEKTLGYDSVTHRPVRSDGLLQLSYQDAEPPEAKSSGFVAENPDGSPRTGKDGKPERVVRGVSGYSCNEISWPADKERAQGDPQKSIYNPFVQLHCSMRIFERLLTENRNYAAKDCPQYEWKKDLRRVPRPNRASRGLSNLEQAGGCYWSSMRSTKSAAFSQVMANMKKRSQFFCAGIHPSPEDIAAEKAVKEKQAKESKKLRKGSSR